MSLFCPSRSKCSRFLCSALPRTERIPVFVLLHGISKSLSLYKNPSNIFTKAKVCSYRAVWPGVEAGGSGSRCADAFHNALSVQMERLASRIWTACFHLGILSETLWPRKSQRSLRYIHNLRVVPLCNISSQGIFLRLLFVFLVSMFSE